jgi:hypothetical protein
MAIGTRRRTQAEGDWKGSFEEYVCLSDVSVEWVITQDQACRETAYLNKRPRASFPHGPTRTIGLIMVFSYSGDP